MILLAALWLTLTASAVSFTYLLYLASRGDEWASIRQHAAFVAALTPEEGR